MKDETLKAMELELENIKKISESYKGNREHTYAIEYIPILTQRNKNGKLNEFINCENKTIFLGENNGFI